jgi:DNA-binding Lrp family transcriptional regulator
MTRLDRIDFEILARLQKDARISNKELAAEVGLAPSSVHERMRRLDESGVLQGFYAVVDPEALGIRVQALISVKISRHSRELLEQFQEHLRSLPEVLAFYYLAGADDFRVHVATKNADGLRRLVIDKFTTREEIEHMETQLIFGYESKHALPNFAQDS